MPSATPTDPAELLLRPAGPDDTGAVVRIHLAARGAAEAAGHLPAGVRTAPEVADWLRERLGSDETWVAELGGAVVAYVRLTSEWLDDLYVAPEHQGEGVGTALLDLAQALRPGGFGLYVFDVNRPARRFYAARGLVEVAHDDPCGNEEGAPDRMLVWPGRGEADVGAAWQHRSSR